MDEKRNNLVYLTGFMASGKSTIGPILANALGFSHSDLDQEIQKYAGKDIPEIFSEFGEEYFRNVERQVLQTISLLKNYVVSLGGGTIIDDMNFQIVKSTGISVYLQANPEHIYKRLRHKKDRPLIKSIDGETLTGSELKNRIGELLSQREKFYLKADVIISTDGRRVGDTVDSIVRSLGRLAANYRSRPG